MKDRILDVFNFRHACKRFDEGKKIPADEFEIILEAARLSPSSFGFEPWKFLVVQDMERREKLLADMWGAGGQYPTASHVVVALVKKRYFMRPESDYLWNLMTKIHKIPEENARMRRDKYAEFQRVDFKLLESDRAIEDWAGKQTYIALGNMMTVAAMLGIDSCPIEGFNKEAIEKTLAEAFDINTDQYAMGWSVAFGYRIDAQRVKTRQAKEDVVSWY